MKMQKRNVGKVVCALAMLLSLQSCTSKEAPQKAVSIPATEKVPTPTKAPAVHRGLIEASNESAYKNAIATGNVVVDVYATWCGPCKQMSPIIDSLVNEMPDIQFVKVNSDNYKVAGVRGVPTFIFFKDGKEIGRHVGAMSKPDFKTTINNTFGL